VGQGPTITVDDLPTVSADPAPPNGKPFVIPPDHTLADLERLAIVQTLERFDGNKRAAAKALGVHRPTLYSKLKKFHIGGIRTQGRRTEDEQLRQSGESHST
jgi:DNA-binding NtrC family response regulator